MTEPPSNAPRGKFRGAGARRAAAASCLVLAALSLCALVGPAAPRKAPRSRVRQIVFSGFSILGEPMEEGVFPAFARYWQEKTG
jgi:hypothetical protein